MVHSNAPKSASKSKSFLVYVTKQTDENVKKGLCALKKLSFKTTS